MSDQDQDQEIYTGSVIFFSNKKNFGFIKWDGHPDLFFHFSAIIMKGYKTLNKEDQVQFKLGKNNNGIIIGIEVEKISK